MKESVEGRSENNAEINYFEKADLVLLAETHHGTHFKTILRFIKENATKINGVFFEIPVTYQTSFDAYLKTGQVDQLLEKFFTDSRQEGKDIRGLLVVLDTLKELGKPALCIDSSKLPDAEYSNKSTYGHYYLRGGSRDEDMFENVTRYTKEHPAKYAVITGAGHASQGSHHITGHDTLGARLSHALGEKFASVLLGTPQAVQKENWRDFTGIIVEK